MNKILEKLNSLDDHKLCPSSTPDRDDILTVLKSTMAIIFPSFYTYHNLDNEVLYSLIINKLKKEIIKAYKFTAIKQLKPVDKIIDSFISQLPTIKELLLTDINAIYEGDPATRNKAEVVLCYPGFYAIFIHRIAHALFDLDIPYIPRVMSEYAHAKTGIDIHPGANINHSFCIDHGTGIVIGETANLGHHVKLYQGVTIGAKSFELGENGLPIKGGKRHPDLGNYVTVYANATILGGDTVIGNNVTIGGNVWITKSVADNQIIYYHNN